MGVTAFWEIGLGSSVANLAIQQQEAMYVEEDDPGFCVLPYSNGTRVKSPANIDKDSDLSIEVMTHY